MPSGSRVALGVVGIGVGGLVVIGSIAGTLAAALAGLFDPSILEPATQGSGGIPIIPGTLPSAAGTTGEPASEPSATPIGPGGSNGALPPGSVGALPSSRGFPELPPGATLPEIGPGGGGGVIDVPSVEIPF